MGRYLDQARATIGRQRGEQGACRQSVGEHDERAVENAVKTKQGYDLSTMQATPRDASSAAAHRPELVQEQQYEINEINEKSPASACSLPPLPTDPCFACRGRRWWLRPVDGRWICAVCHPPVLPEVAEILAPLADLRTQLMQAAGALAGELGWPRLPLDGAQTVLPGTGPWRAFLDRADLPTLRLAIDRLRERLATLEDADGR